MNTTTPSIPVTESMRQLALQALRTKGISKTQLAESVGLGKAWVTKFFDGSIKNLKEETLFALEDLLGIKFFATEAVNQRSSLALRIAALIDSDPAFAKLALALDEVLTMPRPSTTRFIPTPDMTRIGQEIIRVCFANEDKPGKVAREVLKLLA